MNVLLRFLMGLPPETRTRKDSIAFETVDTQLYFTLNIGGNVLPSNLNLQEQNR